MKPATVRVVLPKYNEPFYFLLAVWILVSALFGKYTFLKKVVFRKKIAFALMANITVLAITLTTINLLQIAGYSRLMLFGTIGLASVLELFFIWQIIAFNKANRKFLYEATVLEQLQKRQKRTEVKRQHHRFKSSIKKEIISRLNEDIYEFIETYVPFEPKSVLFTITQQRFNIENIHGKYKAIINLLQINTAQDINSIIAATNHQLPQDGLFFTVAETITSRKKRILSRYPLIFNRLFYFFDYLYHRVFAKVYPTRFIYRKFSHKNRAISKAELLGRLYAGGFEIEKEIATEGYYACIVRKTGLPKTIDKETIGGLIKLRRIGKDGKIIGVYKFRTMHPYSEYIQAYMFDKNDLQTGGKIKNDFRINSMGKFLRRSWLDEFPMFINIFKGEMKIVGVRPLSEHFFSLYTKELQDLRITTKPGLLPPFYADAPETLEEIMDSEMCYLRAYKLHPLKTDLRYFFKILYNIIIKKRRSQ